MYIGLSLFTGTIMTRGTNCSVFLLAVIFIISSLLCIGKLLHVHINNVKSDYPEDSLTPLFDEQISRLDDARYEMLVQVTDQPRTYEIAVAEEIPMGDVHAQMLVQVTEQARTYGIAVAEEIPMGNVHVQMMTNFNRMLQNLNFVEESYVSKC